MIIGKNKGKVYGQIRKNGKVFDIQYLGEQRALIVEYDMDKINSLACAVLDEKSDLTRHSNKDFKVENFQITRAVQNPSKNEEFRTTPFIIRTLVLFTPAAAGVGLDVESTVNTAFQQWQIAAVNTNTITSLQIAGIQQVNFVETEGNFDPQERIELDIVRLANDLAIQQLRNDFAADIVILITNGNYGGYRGLASEIGPLEPNAYGIVQLTSATSSFTFIHEVGHIFGARHDIDTTPGDAHGHSWQTGFWPFLNKYQSIMSVLQDGTERVLHFSNPQVSHQGKPTGVTGISDNRRVLNVNGPIVEAFRFTAPGLWASINGPASANNGDPLSFIPSIIGDTSPYAYTWFVNTGSGFYFAGNGGYLNINMPTNNNLSIQMVVTDAANGTFTATRTVQNNFSGGGCSICPEVFEKTDLDPLESQVLEADIIFPNPASHIVTAVIQPELNWNKEFEIIDLNNGIVLTKKIEILSIEGNKIDFNVSKLPKGVYLLQYEINNLIKSIKFIKN